MNTTTSHIDLYAMLRDPKTREAGYRELMRLYGRQTYWHIRRIVVSHDDAEDAFQETMIKIYQGIGKFRGECSLLSWIYRIATNEALQLLRRNAGVFRSIDSLSDTLANTLQSESDCDGDAIEMLFQKALLQLPTQQRIAFNMRYYDDMSYDDIAKATGKNAGTIKANYHYAIEKIKNYIKENSDE